jgi:ABC-type nitrate/sulfonate/bicarbonate transport system substrate-binding protein
LRHRGKQENKVAKVSWTISLSIRRGVLRYNLVLVLASLAVLAAPGDSRASEVVIGQGVTIGWAPFFVADDLDLWKKNGLDTKIVSFPSGRLVIESILGGSATFGTATETPVALAALNDLPIRILAVIDTHEVYDLVATSDIREVEDIKGKRIAYSSGTNAQVYLARLLDRSGLKFGDISAVSLNPAEMVSGLANGSVDGFVWSEPHQSQAIALKPGAFHRLHVPGLYTQYSTIVTTQRTIDTRRGELVSALKALIAADAYISASPEDAGKLTAAKIKMDPELAAEVWRQITFGVSLDRAKLVAELRNQGQWAIDSGIARPGTKLPNFEAVVDNSLLDEARQSLLKK